MFETPIKPIRMRSWSPQAYDFWKNQYKPTMDAIKQRILAMPMSVGIWADKIGGIPRIQLYEIQNDLEKQNIRTCFWAGKADDKPGHFDEAMAALDAMSLGKPDDGGAEKEDEESENEPPEVIFGILLNTDFNPAKFLTMSADTAARLFLFISSDVEKSIKARFRKEDKEFRFQSIFRRSMVIQYPKDFEEQSFSSRFLNTVDVLRRAKYLQSLIPEHQKPLKAKRNIFSFYKDYKTQIDVFQSSGHNYFISFIRFLTSPTKEMLEQHLEVPTDDAISELCHYFQTIRFLSKEKSGQLELTYSGNKYFRLLGLESLPILAFERRRFKERWKAALEKTYHCHFELLKNNRDLKKLSDQLYFSLARDFWIGRKIRYLINQLFFTWLKKEEKQFLEHPWAKPLFDIWRENIAGVKKIWRSRSRDRIAFLEYMNQKFTIAHHPNNSDLYVNHKNLAFNTTMLRPNSHAHFYVIFSFEFRSIKKMIQEYFDLAAVTGQYDLLMRRYGPYHVMLKLYAYPGDRTSFDMRNILDWQPLTVKMETKFTVPVELKNVRTRQRDRFISIPVRPDTEEERIKRAEIAALEGKIADINKTIFTDSEFGSDGKIYFTEKDDDEPKPVENFAGKRTNFIHTSDELKLVKAIPRPGADSGLLVRFNLLDPIAVLINGINRKRDLDLNEIRHLAISMDYVAKLPAMPKETQSFKTSESEEAKGTDKKKPLTLSQKLDTIIDTVFYSTEKPETNQETSDLLEILDQIEKMEASEDEAWSYLISRFIHGHHHPILVAVCNRLMKEGFEVLFSLWPLLTGKELKMDDEGNVVEEIQVVEPSKNQLPLIENLKRELSDLMKNVFTRHIDISGATRRTQSEARFAQMIVAHCLNVKSDADDFKKRLWEHLNKHYEIHHFFMKEHLGDSDLIRHIHKFDKDGKDGKNSKKMIEEDVKEIVKAVDMCRKRLFSRMNNNRLLCFIDPNSVEVQIGEFEYGGDAIKSEMDYIKTKEKKQKELAEKQKAHDADVKEMDMEKEAKKKKGKIERETLEAGLNKEKAIREMKYQHEMEEVKAKEEKEETVTRALERINEFKLRQITVETRLLAAEALKDKDMKNYAILSLLDAHHNDGGSAGVERLLKASPNLLFAIAPEALEARHVHELKQSVVEKMDAVMEKVDPLAISTLFSKDYGELVRSDIYKTIMRELADVLKNFGYRGRPVMEQVFGGVELNRIDNPGRKEGQ